MDAAADVVLKNMEMLDRMLGETCEENMKLCARVFELESEIALLKKSLEDKNGT